jgi:hypothetical protein
VFPLALGVCVHVPFAGTGVGNNVQLPMPTLYVKGPEHASLATPDPHVHEQVAGGTVGGLSRTASAWPNSQLASRPPSVACAGPAKTTDHPAGTGAHT